MEMEFIALILLGIVLIFSGLIALIWVAILSSRLKKLEKLLKSADFSALNTLGSSTSSAIDATSIPPKPDKASATTSDAAIHTAASHLEIPKPPKREKTGPDVAELFFAWLARDWYLKLGALLMLLAVIWFVTYAFMNNWIGPSGRIALGLIAGVGVLVFAQWWQTRAMTQATVIYGLGASMILATTWAARNMFDMFTPATALVGMLLVVLTVAVSSALANTQSRAVLSVLSAACIPFLVNAGTDDYFGLLRYALVITVGFIALVFWKQWQAVLIVLSGILMMYTVPKVMELANWQSQLARELQWQEKGSYAPSPLESYSFGYSAQYGSDRYGVIGSEQRIVSLQNRLAPYANLWVYLASFSMLLFAAGLYLMSKERKITSASLLYMVIVAIYVIAWIYGAVVLHIQGVAAALAAVIYTLLAAFVARQRDSRKEGMVLLFVALGLLAAAAAFMLDGPALTISLMVLVASYVAGGTWLLGATPESRPLGFLYGLTTFLMFPHLMGTWSQRNPPVEDWFVIIIYVLSLAVTLYLWKYVWQAGESAQKLRWLSSYYLTILAVLMVFWTRLLHYFLPYNQTGARAITLATFATLGIVFYLRGRMKNGPVMRWTGIALVGGTTAQLLLVETGQMALATRIVTFFFVGALFIGVALLEKKLFPHAEESKE